MCALKCKTIGCYALNGNMENTKKERRIIEEATPIDKEMEEPCKNVQTRIFMKISERKY